MLNKIFKYSFIMVLIAGCLMVSAQTRAETVKYVIDGDTIILQDKRHVRYIGINAPEIAHKDKKGQPFGQESKKFNNKLVGNNSIILEFDQIQKDQYGRTLAYVFLKNNTFVNGEIIKQGLGFCLYDKQNNHYFDKLLSLQQKAMSREIGIWSRIKKIKGRVVGSSKSLRFHKPECKLGKRISKKNQVWFNSQWEAFEKGYSPGKKCLGNN
ncbi:Nuclease, related to Staphylococcal nuclease (SNase) [Desulfonema limicola]|uniref:Nuclease, related to Staphylococcal nuclease (SNase) n=1 Tax=Desulfonema limicola TaxID=45656 RepID=A0A975GI73_9BACT|nr:thermonuclease family protein [Desulfonema limicola]QTA82211.1 Nuclease, related to Staphylococcal nuclease (SNase) [Desulfonema limicola]